MRFFQDKMELLEKISLSEVENENSLLEVFSFLVSSSRPDYIYNETYLRDFIPDFQRKKKIYRQKLKFVKKLHKRLRSLVVKGPKKINITLDNIWEIEFKKEWTLYYAEEGNLSSLSNDELSIDIKIEWNGQTILDYFMKAKGDNIVTDREDSENADDSKGVTDEAEGNLNGVNVTKECAATLEESLNSGDGFIEDTDGFGEEGLSNEVGLTDESDPEDVAKVIEKIKEFLERWSR